MTTNCFEREHLFAYASKMLDDRDGNEVRAHLLECEACREVAERYRQLDRVLDLWHPTEPSPWFEARVRAAVATAGEHVSSLWSRVLAGLAWSRWLAPALVAVMVVVVSAVIIERPRWSPDGGTKTAPLAHKGPGANAPSPVGTQEEKVTTVEGPASTLDDYELLANFEVLSELPKPEAKVAD